MKLEILSHICVDGWQEGAKLVGLVGGFGGIVIQGIEK